MEVNFYQKLRELISKSRKIPLAYIKQSDINKFLTRIPNIYWCPDYLFLDTQHEKYLAFTIIYEADYFPNNLSQEVEKAMINSYLEFFFIIEDKSLLDIFEEDCRKKGFGIILNVEDKLILIRDTVKSVIIDSTSLRYVGHYPLWLIQEIDKINLGNSIFRTVLIDFSKEYLRLINNKALNWNNEESLVKNTIANILESDVRFKFEVNSLDILSRFESFLDDIRDHYFHSFHIFLLGLLIIDTFKDEFCSYYNNSVTKCQAFSLEFLWLLTSIFHDVGYPIARLDYIREEIYGFPIISSEREITNVWNDPIYKENLKQLISLFKFLLADRKPEIDWYPEVFGTEDDNIDKLFRESFFDSHGVAGCFRFLVDIFFEARRQKEAEKKIFLIYHIYPAALSIALHNRIFRNRLKEIGIDKIKLSRFPFAVLLIYLDNLQEDRRDKFLSIETPELLQGFEYNGKVIACINESLAESYPRLGKLKAECIDFANFVECDGIKFEYPKLLLE